MAIGDKIEVEGEWYEIVSENPGIGFKSRQEEEQFVKEYLEGVERRAIELGWYDPPEASDKVYDMSAIEEYYRKYGEK